ncbi:MAG: signal peptidase II [Candidatus Saelkia tenebricola]|nr:signal peptidase II [Candidatus Saelkia tenebricola]
MKIGPCKKGLYFFFILIFVISDQVVKSVLIKFPLNSLILQIIPHYFEIRTLINPGIAFGLCRNFPQLFLWLNLVIITYFFIYFVFRLKKKNFFLPLALILGGATSNLMDRFFYGGILDYLDLGSFPTFNLADTYITFGIIFILKDVFFRKDQSS